MKLSLLKQIHHFPDVFFFHLLVVEDSASHRTLEKNTRTPHWAAKHLESCNFAVVSAGNVLTTPYTPKCNGHGFHLILHRSHKPLQPFREFLRLCIQNRCGPSHSQMISRSSMILISTRPSQHVSIHLALPTSRSPPLTALQVASKMPRFSKEICQSKAGWLGFERMGVPNFQPCPLNLASRPTHKQCFKIKDVWPFEGVLPCSPKWSPFTHEATSEYTTEN